MGVGLVELPEVFLPTLTLTWCRTPSRRGSQPLLSFACGVLGTSYPVFLLRRSPKLSRGMHQLTTGPIERRSRLPDCCIIALQLAVQLGQRPHSRTRALSPQLRNRGRQLRHGHAFGLIDAYLIAGGPYRQGVQT